MSLETIITTGMTAIFLLILLLYYGLLLWKRKLPKTAKVYDSLAVIIPAHNEERYIADCIRSVQQATFRGRKDIIVLDDGSEDNTLAIAKRFDVQVRSNKHRGKAATLNYALRITDAELIAIVDGDGIIHKDAFVNALPFLKAKKTAVVGSVVKVYNRKHVLGWWLHIEQLYNSLLRGLFAKVNVNIVSPGPLSIYKRSALEEIGGFSTEGFSEDVDVAIRLIKKGYRVDHCDACVSETNLPLETKWFFKQRHRFARGWINILKRHLRLDHTFWQIFTLPLAFFWYLQAVIMGTIQLITIAKGYVAYFASQGTYFSGEVVRYFFEWLSLAGVIRWMGNILDGSLPFTGTEAIAIAATLLSYPLYLVAVIKYDRKLSLLHLIPIFFMTPFWLLIMVIYILNIGEVFRRKQYNIWQKRRT